MRLRKAETRDQEECANIIFEAFGGIADRYGFPYDFPDIESARRMAEYTIECPFIYGVVAEDEGRVVGSNFLWEFDEIAGIGPITVDPGRQSNGLGHKLMSDVIERGKTFAGLRLVQDAFNSTSMSLYTRLGFNIVEPLVLMAGRPSHPESDSDLEVRRLQSEDVEGCAELCRRVHGFDRLNETTQNLEILNGYLAEENGRIVAYATAPDVWQMNHAVAETTAAMKELLNGAFRIGGRDLSFLLPVRQSDLFRWCLNNGLKIAKPMNLMSLGKYCEPNGCFLPSVLY